MTQDRGSARRTRPPIVTTALVGAACVAGVLGAAGLAAAGDYSARASALAVFCAAGALAATGALLAPSDEGLRASVLAGVAAWTAAVAVLGALSFGPLLAPAFVLWACAAFAQARRGHASGIAVATGVLWGAGLGLLGTLAIVTLVGLGVPALGTASP